MPQPSIFNDVLGPVMRGPSSSHCAAANRIGLLAFELMGGIIKHVVISFDTGGALATTHESQGTDMGLFGGLMGWDCRDERLVDSVWTFAERGHTHELIIDSLEDEHPNTYNLVLSNAAETHELIAISTGGGMIEVLSIDGFQINCLGDNHETLIFLDQANDDVAASVRERVADAQITSLPGSSGACLRVTTPGPLDASILESLTSMESVSMAKALSPVLPVLTPASMNLPFATPTEMWEYAARQDNPSLAELAMEYECARAGIAKRVVLSNMVGLVKIWRESIAIGLGGTDYDDRVLGSQSPQFQQAAAKGKLADGGALNVIIPYVSALMEVKSSMGLIIAAPTAGACATLPGALIGLADHADLDDDTVAQGMLAAGLIGVFIADGATFAAEVGGCQAETGSAAGMAAAGIVTMMNGTTKQAVAAASVALQNTFGMICDPVANRVEVPCLGKNVMGAANAVCCANMALADYDPIIPLDEVIQTMDVVGRNIPHEYRCTALGGLSTTPTSKAIEARLQGCKGSCSCK